MAFPPPTRPTTFTNDQPQLDTHPAEHTALSAAVNDLTSEVLRVRDFGVVWSGTIQGTTTPVGQGTTVATFTTPTAGTWMVFYSVFVNSSAAVAVTARMFAAGAVAFESTMRSTGNGTLHLTAITGALPAGSGMNIDLLNGGTQPVDCYSDGSNHRLLIMRVA